MCQRSGPFQAVIVPAPHTLEPQKPASLVVILTSVAAGQLLTGIADAAGHSCVATMEFPSLQRHRAAHEVSAGRPSAIPCLRAVTPGSCERSALPDSRSAFDGPEAVEGPDAGAVHQQPQKHGKRKGEGKRDQGKAHRQETVGRSFEAFSAAMIAAPPPFAADGDS